MMKDETSTGSGGQGQEEGLSFAMLSRLIAEGRTEDVPMKQIPEGTNVSSSQIHCLSGLLPTDFIPFHHCLWGITDCD
jgi:hypothetical protein